MGRGVNEGGEANKRTGRGVNEGGEADKQTSRWERIVGG